MGSAARYGRKARDDPVLASRRCIHSLGTAVKPARRQLPAKTHARTRYGRQVTSGVKLTCSPIGKLHKANKRAVARSAPPVVCGNSEERKILGENIFTAPGSSERFFPLGNLDVHVDAVSQVANYPHPDQTRTSLVTRLAPTAFHPDAFRWVGRDTVCRCSTDTRRRKIMRNRTSYVPVYSPPGTNNK